MGTKEFGEVLVKYHWAQKHIRNLEASLTAIRNTDGYDLSTEDDSETGEVTYYCSKVSTIQDEIRLMLGDAIHNLRSTLDHLAHKIVEAAPNGIVDKWTCFPIFDSPHAYNTLKHGKVKGIGQFAMAAIDRLQPYKGGNSYLWILHQLDIADKHRLILTVGHGGFGYRVLHPKENNLPSQGGINPGFAVDQRLKDAIKVHPVPFPLKAGDKLMTISREYAETHIGFMLDVAINEPGVAEGYPLTLLLGHLDNEVGIALNNLAPYV